MNWHRITAVLCSILQLLVVSEASSRIIGGQPVKPNEYPFIISLRMGGMHVCGGTILSDCFILTAAHCINPALKMSKYTVHIGSNLLTQGQKLVVANITRHEKYIGQSDWWKHDIALIKLKNRLSFSKSVKSISISSDYIAGGEEVYVLGWGLTMHPAVSFPHKLQILETKTLNFTSCQKSWKNVQDIHLCLWTGFGSHYGFCKGDSGGPVVYQNKLIGVVSWNQVYCNTEKPDVVVRLAPHYLDWINKKMKL